MDARWKGILVSRKFWAAVIGTIFVVVSQFAPNFPFSAEAVTEIVYLTVAYIVGTGVSDVRINTK